MPLRGLWPNERHRRAIPTEQPITLILPFRQLLLMHTVSAVPPLHKTMVCFSARQSLCHSSPLIDARFSRGAYSCRPQTRKIRLGLAIGVSLSFCSHRAIIVWSTLNLRGIIDRRGRSDRPMNCASRLPTMAPIAKLDYLRTRPTCRTCERLRQFLAVGQEARIKG